MEPESCRIEYPDYDTAILGFQQRYQTYLKKLIYLRCYCS